MVRPFSASRRSFFRSAAALGGAAAALALGGDRKTAKSAPAPPRSGGTSGYRLTEHIAKYYEKARG
ncbi:MAG TPA: formate dehydrogenase [bacterium]